jgi:hypothetical protein
MVARDLGDVLRLPRFLWTRRLFLFQNWLMLETLDELIHLELNIAVTALFSLRPRPLLPRLLPNGFVDGLDVNSRIPVLQEPIFELLYLVGLHEFLELGLKILVHHFVNSVFACHDLFIEHFLDVFCALIQQKVSSLPQDFLLDGLLLFFFSPSLLLGLAELSLLFGVLGYVTHSREQILLAYIFGGFKNALHDYWLLSNRG